MDRQYYNSRVIDVFDTIGSFFVNVFYNHHYAFSRNLVQMGKIDSITDAYYSTVLNYMKGISERQNLYVSVVEKLHEYCLRYGGYGLFSEFENKILSQFIPPEYYRDFTERHKDATLHEIIIKTVNHFGEAVLSKDILHLIIDKRENKEDRAANISLLQDRIVNIFIMQREDYYAKFAQQISRSNANDKVSKGVFDKLKLALVEEKQKKCNMQVERDRALGLVSQLVKKVTALEQKLQSLNENNSRDTRDTAEKYNSATAQNIIDNVDSSDSGDDSDTIQQKRKEFRAKKYSQKFQDTKASRVTELSEAVEPIEADEPAKNDDLFNLLDDDPGFG